MQIMKPSENRFLKALIFGPTGQGKTRFLGTAEDDPRTSPMLIMSYEGGTMSLVGRDIDIVEIRSWEDFNEVYKMLSQGSHKYKSIGLDSVSEVHIFSLLNLLDNDAKGRSNPDLLQQGDYGIALVQMRRLLRKFRDLDLHVFATALAREETDVREGLVKKPSLVGSLADEAPGIFDVVAYLALSTGDEGETHRVLLLQNYPKIRAKCRAPIGVDVPDELFDPTVTSLMDVLGFELPKNSRKE